MQYTVAGREREGESEIAGSSTELCYSVTLNKLALSSTNPLSYTPYLPLPRYPASLSRQVLYTLVRNFIPL